MARQAVIGGSSGGFLSKVIGTLALIAVVAFIVKSPVLAADMFTILLGWAETAVEAGVSFLQRVAR